MDDALLALSVDGFRVLVPPEARRLPMTGRFIDVPVTEVLDSLASVISPEARVFKRPGYIYVGPPTEADYQLSSYVVPSADANEWSEVYRLAASGGAVVSAVGDTLVVRDTAAGTERVAELHESISDTRNQYSLDVVFVELTQSRAKELGVEFTLDGFSNLGRLASGGMSSAFEAVLSGNIIGRGSTTDSAQYEAVTLHLVEGEPASLQIGDSINVPTRTVSPEGTVTDSGYQTFETGTQLSVVAHGINSGRVRLDIEPELSVVRELVNGLPTISRRRFESSAFVGLDSVLVLGGLSRQVGFQGDRLFPGSNLTTSRNVRDDQTRLFVFLRLRNVGDGKSEPISEVATQTDVSSGL